MSNIVLKQIGTLASKLGMEAEAAGELMGVLKATAFKGQVSDAQLSALLVVANQYGLNPWTKEIYAFPDKQNGIVPVVGVDGWARIINSHPQFDGMEFHLSEKMVRMDGARNEAPEWMECVMYRKDRSRPIVIREYLDEVYRPPFKKDNGYQVDGPWQTHTKRFLRHKTMIQCARLAFGFVGIYDEDEAERIRDMGNADVVGTRPLQEGASASEVLLPLYSDDDFRSNKPKWLAAMNAGRTTPERIVAMVSSKYELSDAQRAAILAMRPEPAQAQAEPAQATPSEQQEAQPAASMAEHADFLADYDKE